jgi:drug/metabolite transporter (DMT)-like permease
MGTEPPVSRVRLGLAFASIYILWGSTYLAMLVAVRNLPPFLMAGARFLLAGSALYALGVRQGSARPTGRQWRNALLSGIPLFVLGNGGVAWAVQSIPSGVAALVAATLPAWLLLLDWGYGGRGGPRVAEAVGIALGVGGVAALLSQAAAAELSPAGIAAVVGASIAWACGSLFSRYSDLPTSPFRTSGMQMLTGGACMVAVGLALGEGGRFAPAAVSWKSAVAFAYLVVVAVVALPAYTWLLTVSSPALVGTYAFVNPIVAVLLGWALAGETLSGRTGLAVALVVAGVALLTWPRRTRARTITPPEP